MLLVVVSKGGDSVVVVVRSSLWPDCWVEIVAWFFARDYGKIAR